MQGVSAVKFTADTFIFRIGRQENGVKYTPFESERGQILV